MVIWHLPKLNTRAQSHARSVPASLRLHPQIRRQEPIFSACLRHSSLPRNPSPIPSGFSLSLIAAIMRLNAAVTLFHPTFNICTCLANVLGGERALLDLLENLLAFPAVCLCGVPDCVLHIGSQRLAFFRLVSVACKGLNLPSPPAHGRQGLLVTILGVPVGAVKALCIAAAKRGPLPMQTLISAVQLGMITDARAPLIEMASNSTDKIATGAFHKPSFISQARSIRGRLC